VTGDDGHKRCWWCDGDADYQRYHDQEWGIPVTHDQGLFEKVCLEGFQCGLSWLTILRRREAFREAFHHFDYARVARMNSRDVAGLLNDDSIIRHRGKIEATIANAKLAIETIQQHGSLAAFFWQFEPRKHTSPKTRGDVVATTDESARMSRELKRQGWKFVGPTTCYALMQAMGMVNDHLAGCDFHANVERLRSKLDRPILNTER